MRAAAVAPRMVVDRTLAAELIIQAHAARRYEKDQRRKLADALVDLALENAQLRHENAALRRRLLKDV